MNSGFTDVVNGRFVVVRGRVVAILVVSDSVDTFSIVVCLLETVEVDDIIGLVVIVATVVDFVTE